MTRPGRKQHANTTFRGGRSEDVRYRRSATRRNEAFTRTRVMRTFIPNAQTRTI